MSEKTQDYDGGRVQEPSGMDGADPRMQESSQPPQNPKRGPQRSKKQGRRKNIREAAGPSFIFRPTQNHIPSGSRGASSTVTTPLTNPRRIPRITAPIWLGLGATVNSDEQEVSGPQGGGHHSSKPLHYFLLAKRKPSSHQHQLKMPQPSF